MEPLTALPHAACVPPKVFRVVAPTRQEANGKGETKPAPRTGGMGPVTEQESKRITQMPQGTLAWDPEYAEYLRWLAEQDQQP